MEVSSSLHLFAGLLSAILGLFSVKIFSFHSNEPRLVFSRRTLPWFVYQSWLNFSASMIGWEILIAFFEYAKNAGISLMLQNLTFPQILLLIIGIIGVTGLLPQTLAHLGGAIAQLSISSRKS